MALVALIVAIVAAALAAVSLAVSWWQARASVRNLDAERRAHIVARRGRSVTLEGGGRTLHFPVRNVGRAPARHVYFSLTDGAGATFYNDFREFHLWPGDPETDLDLVLPRTPEALPAEIHLVVLWKDEESGDGPRTRRLLTVRGSGPAA